MLGVMVMIRCIASSQVVLLVFSARNCLFLLRPQNPLLRYRNSMRVPVAESCIILFYFFFLFHCGMKMNKPQQLQSINLVCGRCSYMHKLMASMGFFFGGFRCVVDGAQLLVNSNISMISIGYIVPNGVPVMSKLFNSFMRMRMNTFCCCCCWVQMSMLVA